MDVVEIEDDVLAVNISDSSPIGPGSPTFVDACETPSENTVTDEAKPHEIAGICVIKFNSLALHRKYFVPVRTHLEKLLRDTHNDMSQLFCVDTMRATENESPTKDLYETVNNYSLVEDALEKVSAGLALTCFNCLGDHHMADCPRPIDRKVVASNRRKQQSKQQTTIGGTMFTPQRFFEDEERARRFVPGKWSTKLLEALGLRRGELPHFIYHMRIFGFPPGWLCDAEIKTSGLKLFDGQGKEVKHMPKGKQRDAAAKAAKQIATEDGELTSSAETSSSEGADEEAFDDEHVTRYDPNKIVEFPGFNIPVPEGYVDDYVRLGMPSIQRHQLKENTINATRFANDISGSVTNAGPTATKRKLVLPPPKCEGALNGEADQKSDDALDDSKSVVSAKKKAKSSDDAVLNDENSLPEFHLTTAGEPENEGATESAASPATGSASLQRSYSLGSVLGTPIPAPISRVTSLPESSAWSVGVVDHIPFENLPGATGTFEKMRGLLAKVKKLRGTM